MSVFYGLTLSISKTSTLDGNLYYLHFADGDTGHREAGCHPQGHNARQAGSKMERFNTMQKTPRGEERRLR